MIRQSSVNQKTLFDPYGHIEGKRKKLLEESWPGIFRREILPELPVKEYAGYFRSDFGRPAKNLYTALGVMVLQGMNNLTDEEARMELAFNEQWHYALNITGRSDKDLYMSLRTIWSTRQRVMEMGLDEVIFDKTVMKLKELYEIKGSRQRIDSVHIRSDMQRLNRMQLMGRAIMKFLRRLKRERPEEIGKLRKKLVEKYLSEKGLGVFSLLKPSETRGKLGKTAKEMYRIVKMYGSKKEICGWEEYQLMKRVFEEQCRIVNDGGRKKVALRQGREVSAGSVQNPSDPDAGFSGHKGEGYSMQVMETFGEEGKPDLITHVDVTPANVNDSEALEVALEKTEEKGMMPEEVLADASYGGDDNVERARKKGVDLISPVKGREEKRRVKLSEFEFGTDYIIRKCPMGHKPVSVSYNRKKKRYTAYFEYDVCMKCRMWSQCRVKYEKGDRIKLKYSAKEARVAERRARQETEEFREKYRYRRGIEATISALERRMRIKRSRYRGIRKMNYMARMKATGLNILRTAKAVCGKGKNPDRYGKKRDVFSFFEVQAEKIPCYLQKYFVKEQFSQI